MAAGNQRVSRAGSHVAALFCVVLIAASSAGCIEADLSESNFSCAKQCLCPEDFHCAPMAGFGPTCVLGEAPAPEIRSVSVSCVDSRGANCSDRRLDFPQVPGLPVSPTIELYAAVNEQIRVSASVADLVFLSGDVEGSLGCGHLNVHFGPAPNNIEDDCGSQPFGRAMIESEDAGTSFALPGTAGTRCLGVRVATPAGVDLEPIVERYIKVHVFNRVQ